MLLNIRCLVTDRVEETDSFITFAKMAQDNGNLDLSSRVLISLKQEIEHKKNSLGQLDQKATN